MSSTVGPPPPGSLPLADITGRMAVFGRLFCEDVGLADASVVPDASDVVAIVKARVPRSTEPGDESPVFEAAAFVGEWLRLRTDARWVAEGPFEPHLHLQDATRSVVYLVPLVSVMRVATTAGYDGMPAMLDGILRDVSEPPDATTLAYMRVLPEEDAPRVIAWLHANAAVKGAHATLWRRCSACARTIADDVAFEATDAVDWEAQAADAAGILTARPFACPCGGPPGEVSRFLIARGAPDGTRFADIHVAGPFTRIACWTLADGRVTPLDATDLALEDARTKP